MPAKSKKGKTMDLNEFLDTSPAPAAAPAAPAAAPANTASWADDVPEDATHEAPVKGERKERSKAGSWGQGSGAFAQSAGGGGDWRTSGAAPGGAPAPGGNAGGGYSSARAPSKLPDSPPYQAYVGSLSYDTTEAQLKDFFGDVKEVRVVSEPDGKSKGFAYVDFNSLDALKAALTSDGTTLQGRKIRVDVNKDGGGKGGNAASGFNALSEDWRGSMGSGRAAPSTGAVGAGGKGGKGEQRERGSMGLGSRGGGGMADFSRASFGGSRQEEEPRAARPQPAREAAGSSRVVPDFNRDLVGSELRSGKPAAAPAAPARFEARDSASTKPAPTFSRDAMGGVLESEKKKEEERIVLDKKREEERARRSAQYSVTAAPSRDFFGGSAKQEEKKPEQREPEKKEDEKEKEAEVATDDGEEEGEGGWADEEVDFEEVCTANFYNPTTFFSKMLLSATLRVGGFERDRGCQSECSPRVVLYKNTVEIAQLWQHNRGNYTTPTIYQKKK